MNENFGVKGGKRDRKIFLLLKRKKRKEKEAIDKQIQRNDIKLFFKVFPLSIIGNAIKIITEKKQKSTKNSPKQEITTETTNKKEEDNNIDIKDVKKDKENLDNKKIIIKVKEKKIKENIKVEIKEESPQTKNNNIKDKVIKKKNNNNKKIKDSNKNESINNTNLKEKKQNDKNNEFKNIQTIIEQKKVITEYENKLKDVKFELRKIYFDYNKLDNEDENIHDKEQIDTSINKANTIIKKLEELKDKLTLENINNYDNNYLKLIIKQYINEIADKDNSNITKEINNSDIYQTLSEEIENLNNEKNHFEEKLKLKNEQQKNDEKNIKKLKEEYIFYNELEKKIKDFQLEQLILIKEMEEKIKNSKNVYEKVEIEVSNMNKQSKKLLKLLAIEMAIPKLNGTKSLINTTIMYMYFMKHFINPKLKAKKYKVIKITDYSNDIENSINSINKTELTLKTTYEKIENIIDDFTNQYKDYFDTFPECKNLLLNLKTIQDNLLEKEYELSKLKQVQEKNLEKNNEKVKKLNNKIEQ